MTSKKDSKRQAAEPQPASTVQAPKAPNPETPAQALQIAKSQVPVANKQTTTIAKLKDGWAQRGIDLGRLIEKADGKFILLLLPNFPECKVGPSGGLEVALPSYPNAYDAAINGDTLLAKLLARKAKQAAANVQMRWPGRRNFSLHQWRNRKRLQRGRHGKTPR